MSQCKNVNIAKLLFQRERGIVKGRNIAVGQTSISCSKALGSWTEQDFMHHCSSSYVDFKPVPRSTIAAAFSPNGKLLASTHGDHTVKIIDCFTGTCIKVLEGHTRTPWVVRFHPLDSDIFASGSLDHKVVVWRISTGEKIFNHDFGKPIASIAFHPSGKALIVASGHKVYFWDYSKPASSTRPHQNPSYILRTKRSLRALHFHPLGLPLVLTAEVVENKRGTTSGNSNNQENDLNPEANAPGITNMQTAMETNLTGITTAEQSAALAEARNIGALGRSLSDVARRVLDMAGIRLPGSLQAVARALMQSPRTGSSSGGGAPLANSTAATEAMRRDLARLGFVETLSAVEHQVQEITQTGSATTAGPIAAAAPPATALPPNLAAAAATQGQIAAVAAAAAAAMSAMERMGSAAGRSSSGSTSIQAAAAHMVDLAMCDPWGMQKIRSAVGSQTHAFPLEPQPLGNAYDLVWGWETSSTGEATRSPRQNTLLESQLMPLAVVSEQPCVVNLNVWSFNHRRPTSVLDRPRIEVPRAVLCSEMGAQFSPCGRFLAVCVAVDELSEAAQVWQHEHMCACKMRMTQAEAIRESAMSRFRGSATNASKSTSPAAAAAAAAAACSSFSSGSAKSPAEVYSSGHPQSPADPFPGSEHMSRVDTGDGGFMVPVSQAWEVFPNEVQWLEFRAGTPQVRVDEAVQKAREASGLNKPLYELRIYSLEGSTFGKVLRARLIRAAHCLTSLQFSPTSDHLLVAYGRRFISLCNLVAEGRTLVPAHTVIEMYRADNLELIRALPSLDDEVNVAAFHPVPGAGIVYGTKEGKLRTLKYDRRTPKRPTIAIATGDGRMDEELAAAERDDSRESSSSGEEDNLD